jgi:sugar/nucleoside kinase (ribokinase family)
MDKSQIIRGVFAGLTTIDLAYDVEAFPAPNGKVAARGQEITAGGPASNAAVTFAHFGGNAELITAIGCHPMTEVVRSDLGACGVTIRDAAAGVRQPPPVSSICVLRSTGERSVVSANAGAFAALSYNFDPEWLAGTSIVLVDGHHLELGIQVAAEARRRGVEVVLDGGSWKPGLERLLALVDTAICSQDFVSPQGDVRILGVKRLAVTRGQAPIRYWAGEEAREIAVPAVKAVDTLGAGDIFHGAFCWSRASGAEFAEALGFAAKVASESCRHWGTRSWRGHVRA